MNFPELPPQPIRPEAEQQEKEIWQPQWKCFCCQDKGRVQPHLASLVIPDYNDWRDRLPICQLPGCGQSSYWMRLGNNNLDMRFTPAICQQLDMYERKGWSPTVESKVIDLQALANKKAMPGIRYADGRNQRNLNDNREIQQRKAEIEAITSEQWLAMRDEYQQGKKEAANCD